MARIALDGAHVDRRFVEWPVPLGIGHVPPPNGPHRRLFPFRPGMTQARADELNQREQRCFIRELFEEAGIAPHRTRGVAVEQEHLEGALDTVLSQPAWWEGPLAGAPRLSFVARAVRLQARRDVVRELIRDRKRSAPLVGLEEAPPVPSSEDGILENPPGAADSACDPRHPFKTRTRCSYPPPASDRQPRRRGS